MSSASRDQATLDLWAGPEVRNLSPTYRRDYIAVEVRETRTVSEQADHRGVAVATVSRNVNRAKEILQDDE